MKRAANLEGFARFCRGLSVFMGILLQGFIGVCVLDNDVIRLSKGFVGLDEKQFRGPLNRFERCKSFGLWGSGLRLLRI